MALPDATEDGEAFGTPTLRVNNKLFVCACCSERDTRPGTRLKVDP